MARRAEFNSTLWMPVIDAVVAALLVLAAGYLWFETSGKARLAAGSQSLAEARARNASDVEAAKKSLADRQDELAQATRQREERKEELVRLQGEIEMQQERVRQAAGQDEALTGQLLDLRLEVQRVRTVGTAGAKQIDEVERRIAQANGAATELAAQAEARNAELARLAVYIAQARDALEADPPSHFPENSSLASMVDMTGEEGRVMVSLARRVKDFGPLNVGLLGSLGLTPDTDTSVKEGGLFANVLLVPRRASVDFEGGISQRTVRGAHEEDLGPFAGATLRFAPSRRERLFLLAGTRYSHEDVGLRLGLGLGRR